MWTAVSDGVTGRVAAAWPVESGRTGSPYPVTVLLALLGRKAKSPQVAGARAGLPLRLAAAPGPAGVWGPHCPACASRGGHYYCLACASAGLEAAEEPAGKLIRAGLWPACQVGSPQHPWAHQRRTRDCTQRVLVGGAWQLRPTLFNIGPCGATA